MEGSCRTIFPFIAEIEVNGCNKVAGRKLKQHNPLNIKPGDAGAKRRLLKEMDKMVAGGSRVGRTTR